MSHFHFIGIGGVSMSGIAMILKHRGHEVTGSDRAPSAATKELEAAGITVHYPQQADNITSDIDTVVYTAAISEDNPELIAARNNCPRVIERSVMLGELLDEYPVAIGVAGTHGKTSTSSMLACIHMAANLDPTFQIGGTLASTNTNYRIGKSDYMLIEACEYCDSFLEFRTNYAIVTNIEAEHLDYFGTFERVKESFRNYAKIMRKDGVLVTSPECAPIFEGIDSRIVTVALKGKADYTVQNIQRHKHALGSSFELLYHGQKLGTLDLFVPGEHLIFDSMCAAANALAEGISFEAVKEGLASYRPTKRRFEYIGEFNGAMVVDDYAHHPSEILSTLLAAKEVEHNTMTVVFQPHTYSRTISFFNDFVKALSVADRVILADIYAAREIDTGEVSSLMLADALKEAGANAIYLPTFDEIKKFLEKNISTGDLLITMGAGNVVNIATDIVKKD